VPDRRRIAGLVSLLGLVLVTLLGAAPTGAGADRSQALAGGNDRPYVPGELLVRFKPETPQAVRREIRAGQRASLKRALRMPGLELLRLDSGASVVSTAAKLEREPNVLYAQPNYVYRTAATPNDPRFNELWGLHSPLDDTDIDMPEAWDVTTGSSAVTVAVVDTGVAYDHPDLAANAWTNPGEVENGADDDANGLVDDVRGWDFVQNDKTPLDFHGHGTHVAGTIGAHGNNAVGVTGVNWQVKLMALRAGDAWGGLSTSAIVSAFDYACSKGAKVINGSFGGPGFSPAMVDAINRCPGSLFVVAAGNGGSDGVGDNLDTTPPMYPCSYGMANIVCVAASDDVDALAPFSNYGPQSVDLAAPGTNILSGAPVYETLFGDGFEVDLAGRWQAGSTFGLAWARTSEAAEAGSFSIADSPGVSYLDGSNTWIQKVTPLNLSGRSGCAIDYMLRLDTEEEFDFLEVEGSGDSAAWTSLGGWSGSTGGAFFPVRDDLSAFDGQANAYLRFRLESDASVTGDGAHIDELAVACLTSGGDYAAYDGTSMATPHVAGVAALIWGRTPGAPASGVKNALLTTVDTKPAFSGRVLSGGRLNAARAVVADTTPPPPPPQPPQPPPPTDTIPPADPAVISTSHSRGVPSTRNTIVITWNGASDYGSGVDGFSYHWATSPGTLPDLVKDAEEGATSMTSAPLPPGSSHYFHLRTRDNAGNWSTGVHFGPFVITAATAPRPQCIVPRLKGKTLVAAKRALVRARCAIGRISRRRSPVRKGRVIAQSPRAGSRRPRGARVSVTISRGRR
jgi:subtilisin family serine protease